MDSIISLSSILLLLLKLIDARLIWKNDISLSSDSLSSDLERIPESLLKSLHLQVDDSKFERLHNFVRNLPEPGPEYHEVTFEEYDYHIDYDHSSIQNQSRKRGADGISDYGKTTDSFVNGTIRELDYDLENLKKEYDSITMPDPDIQTPVALGEFSLPQTDDRPFEASDSKEKTNRCMGMATWKYLFFGFPCFWYTVNNLGEEGFTWNAAVILLRTILAWSALFIVIATIMWCYRGSCCCCLRFEILHPDEAMKIIKNKALLNPPGVERSPDGSVKTYQPSMEESKIYNRLMDQLYS